jgi:hypothetical protein
VAPNQDERQENDECSAAETDDAAIDQRARVGIGEAAIVKET